MTRGRAPPPTKKAPVETGAFSMSRRVGRSALVGGALGLAGFRHHHALGRTDGLALGDTGRLTATVAQIVQLGAPHDAAALDLDGFDVRRQDGEATLHALAEGNL